MKIALTLQPDGRVGWYEPVTMRGPRGFLGDFAAAEHVIEIEPSAILKSKHAETTSRSAAFASGEAQHVDVIVERPLRILVVGAPDAVRNALIVEIANHLEAIRVKYSVCDTPYHYIETGERVHALAAAPEITIEGVDPDFREIKQRTDDPAAGATLAAMMKERDELRASLPNFESQVAELTAAFDEALADVRRERDELREKLRRSHALDDANQASAARRHSERQANEALNAKYMRQNTEIAALRDEIEETRGKRNEWQRRAVAAGRDRDDARRVLTRVRDAATEIVGNLR